jgi:adenosylcobinamide-GDP ribazoletransferase
VRHGLQSAIQFITIVPAGPDADFDAGAMLPFFPVVGLIIGALVSAVDHIGLLLWTPAVAAVVDVVFLAAITGALHLDGLGDSGDGLLGHHPPEKALAIMKDSRIGAMGLVAVVTVLALKAAGIAALGEQRLLVLVLVPAYARAGMLFGMRFLPYGRPAGGLGQGFFENPLTWKAFGGFALVVALSLALGPAALLLNAAFAVVTAAMIGFYRWRLGCITGDMLGAMTEVTEAVLFLAAAAGGTL